MKKEYEDALKKIYDAAKNTKDHYVMCVDLENKEKRKEIVDWLEVNGYIQRAVAFGRSNIRCIVTEKTVEYFGGK